MIDTLDALRTEYEEHEALVSSSKCRDRILFLVENPGLASAELHEYGIKPCCWGTVVFVLGGNGAVKNFWESEGHALDDYSDAMGDFICIPGDGKPGYVGERPMEMFQKKILLPVAKPESGSVISLYWNVKNTEACGFRLRHSGIYLGRNCKGEVIFHQPYEGARFNISYLDDFENGLRQECRETLERKFYSYPMSI